MGFLSAVVGVQDSLGQRVDLPRADGTRAPIMLRFSDNFAAESSEEGGIVVVDLEASALVGATSAATPDTFAKRGASGEAYFGFIGIGTAPLSSAGDIRLPNVCFIRGRNAGNSANVDLISKNGNDVTVGGGVGNATVDVGTTSDLIVRLNFVTRATIDDDGASNGRITLVGSGQYTSAGHLLLSSGGGGTVFLQHSGSTKGVIESAGWAFHAAGGSYGSGTGVAFFANASVNPSTNPSGGFILYGDAGACKIRGSGGTVTTAGPAEPHCPTCDRDYAYEAANDDAGEHLAICWACMLEELEGAGVDVAKFAFIRKLVPAPARAQRMSSARARDAKRDADEAAAKAAKAAHPREQWRAKVRDAAERARVREEQEYRIARAVDLATMAAAAVNAGDTESAAWLLLESAETWKTAGAHEQTALAFGLAKSVGGKAMDEFAADLGVR